MHYFIHSCTVYHFPSANSTFFGTIFSYTVFKLNYLDLGHYLSPAGRN